MQKNIVETARDAGTFTTLIAAIDRAGLESTLAGEGPFTVFAPSAEAFARLLRTFADAERGRWARELHDETLQALGGLRVLLASAVRRGDPAANEQAMRQAIEDIEQEIDNLRAIITDLRPSLLDDLGLLPAIEALLERRRQSGLRITTQFALPARGAHDAALPPELETTIYRLVQEALTNIVKHALASTVRVLVEAADAGVIVEVQDDGRGFDTEAQSAGFGLAGIRERVYVAGGTLELRSGVHGTLMRAELPTRSDAGGAGDSAADQMAS
jgi:signal transduction histidine kinase